MTIAIQEDDLADYFDRMTHSYNGSRGSSEVVILTNPYTKDVKFLVNFREPKQQKEEKFFDDYDAAIKFHSDFVSGVVN